MKFNIIHRLEEGPAGGGNQFLRGLKEHLIQKNRYTSDTSSSDAIIFNCAPNHLLKDVPRLIWSLAKSPKHVAIRIDGPVFLIRGKDQWADKLSISLCRHIAQVVVFQSIWSLEQHRKYSKNTWATNQVIIRNSPEEKFFYPSKQPVFISEFKKIKCIISSWSTNKNKGFDYYHYLDTQLNFSKYEVKFIGRTPIKFKNIEVIQPLDKWELSEALRKADIYITASKVDPCSNSLIEAISCGTVPLAFDDGGHTEIVNDKRLLFTSKEEMLSKLNYVANNFSEFEDFAKLNRPPNAFDSYINVLEQIPPEIVLKKQKLLKITLSYAFYASIAFLSKVKNTICSLYFFIYFNYCKKDD